MKYNPKITKENVKRDQELADKLFILNEQINNYDPKYSGFCFGCKKPASRCECNGDSKCS